MLDYDATWLSRLQAALRKGQQPNMHTSTQGNSSDRQSNPCHQRVNNVFVPWSSSSKQQYISATCTTVNQVHMDRGQRRVS